jgi:hypothetical protein
MDREAVYSALFKLVSSTAGIARSTRRFKLWNEVPQNECPFFIMIQRGETAETHARLPTIWRFHVNLVFYAHNGGHDEIAPMSYLNPIIDSVIATLAPPPVAEEQTLGGLVQKCKIDGEVLTDEGALGEQAIAVLPVTILIPS